MNNDTETGNPISPTPATGDVIDWTAARPILPYHVAPEIPFAVVSCPPPKSILQAGENANGQYRLYADGTVWMMERNGRQTLRYVMTDFAPAPDAESLRAEVERLTNRAEVAEYKHRQAVQEVQPMIIARAERAEASRDAALARVAELEAQNERSLALSRTGYADGYVAGVNAAVAEYESVSGDDALVMAIDRMMALFSTPPQEAAQAARVAGPEHRCLVPVTRFAEPRAGKGAGNAWFAVTGDRPAFFAGIWVPQWSSIRKLKDGETTDDLFGFLTCEPNGVVAPIHGKAMPVILIEPDDWHGWLSAPWGEAKGLQRPLAHEDLVLVEG